MKPVTETVFRAYDIRGVVGSDFDEEWVECLGRAIGTFFVRRGHRDAVVGYDCRHSSPSYQQALTRGLLSTGVDVTALGMVATPLLYFGIVHLGRQAGVMITASHNPPQYNGFKVWAGRGTVHTTAICEIYEIMASGEFAQGQGIGCEFDIVPDYEAAVLERNRLSRPLKVVVDGGNGAGGEVCARILRRMGCEVEEMYCEPDGDFPNHHPDPTIEAYMTDLIGRMRATGADLGIGLDGDADRLGIVDAGGRLLLGDELFSLFARDVLARLPGSLLIGDVKCSHRLFDDIRQHGGRTMMWVTGHSVMKAKMLEENAPMAGELSGHMFFNEGWFGFDDAVYAAARMASILSAQEKPLTELPGWPHACSTPELHVPCPDAVKFAVIKKAQDYFRARHDDVIDIDGVRLNFPDGWGLVRASNTQPVLVMRFEAQTGERLDEIRTMMETPLLEWIAEAGGQI